MQSNIIYYVALLLVIIIGFHHRLRRCQEGCLVYDKERHYYRAHCSSRSTILVLSEVGLYKNPKRKRDIVQYERCLSPYMVF